MAVPPISTRAVCTQVAKLAVLFTTGLVEVRLAGLANRWLTGCSEYPLNRGAVKRGGSLTFPCFYDEKYKSNHKYWCKGQDWLLCKIVAYTNTSGRTSVTDHPTQNMFTVELNSLQDSDSGYYWCAVEISDGSDDGDYVYLTVSSGKTPSSKITSTTAVTPVSATEKTSINETTSGLITNRGLQLIKSRNKKNEYVCFVLLVSETMTKNTETTTAELCCAFTPQYNMFLLFPFSRTTAPPAVTASEKENDTSKSGKIQYKYVKFR
uniref:Ig-like domain-containing protein n=1 Tax=Pygocentrus nattereri TaxID=42514 RepID=A0A3B4DKP9_PYGNA